MKNAPLTYPLLALLPVIALACFGDGDDPAGPMVPDTAYCAPVSQWDEEHAILEMEVLAIVNQRRAMGADCRSEGTFEPSGSLQMDARLRCAARNHSKNMSTADFFAHTNPNGESPWDRIEKAQYSYRSAGENIAWNQQSPKQVMDSWMGSDGHCSNIMNPVFTDYGGGLFWTDNGPYWTQNFGLPSGPN